MQMVRLAIQLGMIVGSSLLAMGHSGAMESPGTPTLQIPAVAGVFEFQVLAPGQAMQMPPQEWYLWRQAERVERQDRAGAESQVWQRGQDGQIFYERQFHHDKRIVEYAPGDLRALQKFPNWQHLVHVIDPAWLRNTLQVTQTTEVLGRRAIRYQGQVQQVVFEVLWLEVEQLPALVRQVYPDREEVLRLRDIHPLPQAPWERVQTEQYQRLDYADLGDMYYDAFVRRIQQREAHRHTHRH